MASALDPGHLPPPEKGACAHRLPRTVASALRIGRAAAVVGKPRKSARLDAFLVRRLPREALPTRLCPAGLCLKQASHLEQLLVVDAVTHAAIDALFDVTT